MLKEKLLSEEFYLNSMSMFLKNSFGMKDRMETYLKALQNLNKISEDIVSRLDLYNLTDPDTDYLTRNNIDEDGTDDKWLDMIGKIFNISRSLNIINNDTLETITLTNKELYIYILVTIAKLNYQGTAEELVDLYFGGDGSGKDPVKDLNILYIWNYDTDPSHTDPDDPSYVPDSDSLSCKVVCFGQMSENLTLLFNNDLLLVESLGITYNKTTSVYMQEAMFNRYNGTPVAPQYEFDPDFSNIGMTGFIYSVFS